MLKIPTHKPLKLVYIIIGAIQTFTLHAHHLTSVFTEQNLFLLPLVNSRVKLKGIPTVKLEAMMTKSKIKIRVDSQAVPSWPSSHQFTVQQLEDHPQCNPHRFLPQCLLLGCWGKLMSSTGDHRQGFLT